MDTLDLNPSNIDQMQESLDCRIDRLNLDLEMLMKNSLSNTVNQDSHFQQMDTDRDSALPRFSPHFTWRDTSEFMTDRESRLFMPEDNRFIEEIEDLAIQLDHSLMTCEDFRSHELRAVSTAAAPSVCTVACNLDELYAVRDRLEGIIGIVEDGCSGSYGLTVGSLCLTLDIKQHGMTLPPKADLAEYFGWQSDENWPVKEFELEDETLDFPPVEAHWCPRIESFAFLELENKILKDFQVSQAELKQEIEWQSVGLSVIRQQCKVKAEQNEVRAAAIDMHSKRVKTLTIQLAKQHEHLQHEQQQLLEESNKLEEAKEDYENNIEFIKCKLTDFAEDLQRHLHTRNVEPFPEEQEPAEEESVDRVRQEIAAVERQLPSSSGRLKESLEMQLYRLKTKLSTLRSSAVLSTSFDLNSSLTFRKVPLNGLTTQRLSFSRPGTPVKTMRIAQRPSTPLLRTSQEYSLRSTLTGKSTEKLIKKPSEQGKPRDENSKELLLAQTRLQAKLEEVEVREKQLIQEWLLAFEDPAAALQQHADHLRHQERALVKEQHQLDLQRLKLSTHSKEVSVREADCVSRLNSFQDHVSSLVVEVTDLLGLI